MLTYVKGFVTIKIGEKEHKVPYDKVDAEKITWDEAVQLSGAKAETPEEKQAKAIGDWHYGYDLRVKAQVRQRFMAELEGPDKAISKAAKALAVALGVTEEQAEVIVRQQRKDLGMEA